MQKTLLIPEQKLDGVISFDGDKFRADNSSSCLQRRKLCPGSGHMERGLPDEKTEFSAEGDMLHWHDAHPEVDQSALSEKQRSIIKRNEYLRDRFLRVDLKRLEIPHDEPFKMFRDNVELFLCDHSGLPLDPPFPGHPDHVIYYERFQVAYIFDSKFGRKAVPKADINMQLRSYAIMFAENFECKEIVAAITQPWLPDPDDFHSVAYTAEMLPAYKEEVLDILDKTKPLDAPRNPSQAACEFCKARAHCREALETLTDLAIVRIKDLTVDELEAMSADIALSNKVITAWENRIRYIAEKQPELLKHHELADPQSIREINDPAEAFFTLMDAGLLNHDKDTAIREFLSCSDTSRNELEQLVARLKDIPAKDAQTQVTAALGSLIVPKLKRRSIVRK